MSGRFAAGFGLFQAAFSGPGPAGDGRLDAGEWAKSERAAHRCAARCNIVPASLCRQRCCRFIWFIMMMSMMMPVVIATRM